MKDTEGQMGVFFIFSELSVRILGDFKLQFTLISAAQSRKTIRTIFSDVFTSYDPARFPGMLDTTPLAKCLALQGAKIMVRSESDMRRVPKVTKHYFPEDDIDQAE